MPKIIDPYMITLTPDEQKKLNSVMAEVLVKMTERLKPGENGRVMVVIGEVFKESEERLNASLSWSIVREELTITGGVEVSPK